MPDEKAGLPAIIQRKMNTFVGQISGFLNVY